MDELEVTQRPMPKRIRASRSRDYAETLVAHGHGACAEGLESEGFARLVAHHVRAMGAGSRVAEVPSVGWCVWVVDKSA